MTLKFTNYGLKDIQVTSHLLFTPSISCIILASEAVMILNDKGLGHETGASIELITSDVLDHYRTYSMLEKLLSIPNNLQEQLSFQIDPQTRALLIEK